MSQKTKQQLAQENIDNFPNNNVGYITATRLREFNQDMIDSLVDEVQYNVDSASIVNNIDIVQSQVDNLIVSGGAIKVAEEGVIIGVSATLNFSGSAVSASFDSASQIATVSIDVGAELDTGSLVTTASFNAYTSSTDSRLDSLEAETGSYVLTASFNSYTSSTDD